MDTLGIIEVLVRIAWILGAVAFVIGLSRMNSPATARNGNLVSAAGMALAIGATAILILARQLLGDGFSADRLGDHRRRRRRRRRLRPVHGPHREDDRDAAAGVAVQRGRRRRGGPDRDRGLPRPRRPPGGAIRLDTNIFIVLDIIIGSITFSGSLIASGKLQGLIPGKPIMIPGGQLVTARPGGDHGRRGASSCSPPGRPTSR